MNTETLKNLISTLEGVASTPAFNQCAENDEQAGKAMREVSLWITALEEQLRHAEVPTIDLIAESYNSLVEAANKSKWIPKEYFANDWVADAREFLIEGHPKTEFKPAMAVAAQKHIQRLAKDIGAGALALRMAAGTQEVVISKFPGVREEFWRNLFEVMINAEASRDTETFTITALQDRRQYAANTAFVDYDFEDVTVAEASGWEYTTPGREMTRRLYTDEDQSNSISFTVTFSSTDSSEIEAVGAIYTDSGAPVGKWPHYEKEPMRMRG
jgi:hypothetical protein